ncbi:hypothetical protein MSKOL_0792 [Methanosarcina sp. Kolksee]|uniref:flippase n=1 Tax=Methanosarcina sp. Kolksee TaxID=1434099 RepID=UPI00061599F9|nr:flippase [Methanosarcina sp. Kolksee]AKB46569.1 hypothetical protein MSKOL_0792 [Methanosarcina sp. Kolksee]
METAKKIAKNSGVLFFSQVFSYILGLFYVMYTARYLGAEGFGIISFALSFSGILGIFTDLGLDTLTVREVARDKSLASKYLGNTFTMKIILSILTVSLTALIFNLISYPAQTIKVVYIVTFSVIVSSFSKTFYSIFRANEKMEYEAFGQILNSLLMLLGVLISIKMHLDIVYFAIIYLVVSVIVLIYSLIICFVKFIILKPAVNGLFWKNTIKEALPFGLTGVFVTIYYWIDSVMLSLMQGNEVVGLYNVAYKLIMALLFIPSVINVTIFPSMAIYYVTSRKYYALLYEKYFKYMFIIGFPIGIGTTLLANRIISLLFGEGYQNSIIALQILVWSSVAIYIGGAFARLLETSNKQMIITKCAGICMIENIILNLLFIPNYSYIGASCATVLTELTSLTFGIIICSKMGYTISKNNQKNILKVIFSSILMSFFIVYFMDLHLLVLILLATVFYFTVLWIIGGFKNDDIDIFKTIVAGDVH